MKKLIITFLMCTSTLFGIAKLQGCPDLSSDEDAILTKAIGDLKFDFDKDQIKYSLQ